MKFENLSFQDYESRSKVSFSVTINYGKENEKPTVEELSRWMSEAILFLGKDRDTAPDDGDLQPVREWLK